MKNLRFLLAFCVLSSSSLSMAESNPDEIAPLVQFLVSQELLGPHQVPTSYYLGKQEDIDKYFGAYICAKEPCRVVDHVYESPFAVLGAGLPPEQQGTEEQAKQAQAQIERTDMKYGADIYDAATWQIALALAAKNGFLSKEKAHELINNQNRAISKPSNRANNPVFQYGYKKPIHDVKQAFTFRMIAEEAVNKDPFYLGKFHDYLSWDSSLHDPQLRYATTWSDWKPITGENAWAQILGPLQAEDILTGSNVPANSPALENAIHSLYAFSAMQAGVGGFYYAPGGSLGNQGPIPRGEISLENNFSVLGALQTFNHILEQVDSSQDASAHQKIEAAKKAIQVMLYGGQTVNGFETLGLLSFLRNGAFDQQRGIFYTHGRAEDPTSMSDWKPDTSGTAGGMAVDINTWGISALGVANIEKWYGVGTALKMWTKVRQEGGYFDEEGRLLGVGYTLRNNELVNPEHLMSTEWTAGAINTVRSLWAYYKKNGTEAEAASLEHDLKAMQAGIKKLRNDNYLAANFRGATPAANFVSVPQSLGQVYLYSSKRAPIPFGWNANTLPSLTSNAWVLMNLFDYNPFQYQGKLEGEDYPVPAMRDLSGNSGAVGEDALPQRVNVKFNKGELGPINNLILSFSLENPAKWRVSKKISENFEEGGEAVLFKGTKMIGLSYNNGSGACQVMVNTATLCKDYPLCMELKTIEAKWSEDGLVECTLK